MKRPPRKYSGTNVASSTFWKRIAAISKRDKDPNGSIYMMGVILQNMEHDVLRHIEYIEAEIAKENADE